jgi:hypothetical protein
MRVLELVERPADIAKRRRPHARAVLTTTGRPAVPGQVDIVDYDFAGHDHVKVGERGTCSPDSVDHWVITLGTPQPFDLQGWSASHVRAGAT